MDTKKYKTTKEFIDATIKKIKDEAIEEGVDTSSDEFQDILLELKKKLLAKKGISLEEYEAMGRELVQKRTA